jgi:hypothetical protein
MNNKREKEKRGTPGVCDKEL